MNKLGTIRFDCLFTSAMKGGETTPNVTVKVSIPGFMKITGETTVKPSSTFPFSEIQKQTLIDSQLMLSDAIVIENLPNAAKNSVTYTPVKSTLTNTGSFDVEVRVSQHYNAAAELVDTPQTYTVTLKGFTDKPNTAILPKKDANLDIYA